MNKATSKNARSESTVILLPQSNDRTLCVRLNGLVTWQEYDRFFIRPFIKIAGQGDPYSLLFHYAKGFRGWSKEAADASFQSIIDYGKNARKLAYINPPESKIFQLKVAKDLFGGEIRFFDENELQEALEWVKN